jgi:hypothetical protein
MSGFPKNYVFWIHDGVLRCPQITQIIVFSKFKACGAVAIVVI